MLKETDVLSPSPEDLYIEKETLETLLLQANDKLSSLIDLCFHRRELFDAWFNYSILSNPIEEIAEWHGITEYAARKRVKTAEKIVKGMRGLLHRL